MSWFPHLEDPWWLLALLLLPILAWLHHRRSDPGALPFSRLPRKHGGAWRLHLPFYLRLAAFALLVGALARPQLGYSWEESLTEGVDINIVLDISGSMGAEDFQPKNRLTVAKEVVKDFISRRPADRLGLVAFAGGAITRAPLTSDRRMLGTLVDTLELHTLPDGTAIGVALATAAGRLKDSEARSRIVVLVTDGVNNAGAIDPRSAARICEGLGIKVYTIGVGTEGRVMVPVTVPNPMTGRREVRRMPMDVQVDEPLLQEIAEGTGGRFFKATQPEELKQIFAEIDQLETTALKTRRYVRYQETFQPLVWAALGLLLAPLALTAATLTVEP